MRYTPSLSPEAIEENHRHFSDRVMLFKKHGLDFAEGLKAVLRETGPLKGTILEIGTGKGHTALALAGQGYGITSVDKDRQALGMAALNLAYENLLSRVKLYVMDAGHMEFEDRSFDNVAAVHFFHHIYNEKRIFDEIDRVLSVKGKVVFVDFSKEGMDIVNSIHRSEGRVHEDSNTGGEGVGSYFEGLGYKIKHLNPRYFWVIIGEKNTAEVK